VGASLSLVQRAGAGPSLTTLRDAPWRVEALDGADVTSLKLERAWSQEFCKPKLVNAGKRTVRVKQVVLFAISHGLPADTHLYGESFQMLSQTAGTLAKPVDLGYSEPKHYKIPQPEGVTALSGLLTLDGSMTFAFTSCRRFMGRLFLTEQTLEVVMDTEGLELAPGQSWDLEEFTLTS
jgi:alpha-galactosidase